MRRSDTRSNGHLFGIQLLQLKGNTQRVAWKPRNAKVASNPATQVAINSFYDGNDIETKNITVSLRNDVLRAVFDVYFSTLYRAYGQQLDHTMAMPYTYKQLATKPERFGFD